MDVQTKPEPWLGSTPMGETRLVAIPMRQMTDLDNLLAV